MLIEECNFKWKLKEDMYIPPNRSDVPKEDQVKIKSKGVYCCLTGLTNLKCVGEEKCVVFQTYKVLSLLSTDYCQRIEDMRKGLMEKGLLKEEKKTPEKEAGMRQKMREFADKHKLIINPYAETKIEWMEKHGRRCYCEPDGSRICPCKFCLKDIKEFNGCCLCRVFVTDNKMKRIEKYQKQKS